MPVLSYINVSHVCNKFPSSVTGSICCERPWSGKIAGWAALHALALSVGETCDELLFMPKLYHPPALIPDQKSRWHRMPILSPDICALPCIVMYVSKDKKKNKKEICMCAPEEIWKRKKKKNCPLQHIWFPALHARWNPFDPKVKEKHTVTLGHWFFHCHNVVVA